MRRKYLASTFAAVSGAVLLLSACSSSGGGGSSGTPTNSAAAPASGGSSVAPASGTPIQLGMINQENTPAGSYPDVRQGALAAVSYINDSLGGFNGAPLKLTPCITDASPASGANCSRKLIGDKVVAVVGGEDFSTSGSIPPLEKAKIPYVGGIPILPDESTNPISFQFSGGSSGAFSAQDQYIAQTVKAKKVNIITTANPAGLAAATTFGAKILAKLGVTDVKSVQAAADAADFTAPVQQIAANNPDAIIVLFGSPGCSRIMQARGSLGITATTFYPGSCLTSAEVKAGGAGAAGALFNSDNMLFTGDDPQVVIWRAQMAKYQPSAVLSAYSQNGFQSVMNLWAAMKKGPAEPTSASIISTLESSLNVPSFMGHPYTCNHKIVPGNPAICSSAQRIIQYKDGKFVDVLNAWVDGAKLVG
jgi:branched-chain amino acid transport system substrate-binding protein